MMLDRSIHSLAQCLFRVCGVFGVFGVCRVFDVHRVRPALRLPPHAAAARADGAAPVAASDDAPFGCGWFDSTHDLASGLQVIEFERGPLGLMRR